MQCHWLVERLGWILLGAFLTASLIQQLNSPDCGLRASNRVEKDNGHELVVTGGNPLSSSSTESKTRSEPTNHDHAPIHAQGRNITRQAINFLRDPDIMVKAFSDCADDPHCHYIFQ